MAEAVLFSIAEKIIRKLGSLALQAALQELGLLVGVQGELDKLKNTISAIRDVLLDAEEKYQKSDPSHQIRGWLAKLKDAVYEADDLLDEFSTEALRRKAMAGNKVAKEVRLFFSSSNQLEFRRKMGHKIKKIRETLDAIAKDRQFALEVRPVETQVVARKRVQPHSYVPEEKIIGREKDKEAIINLLLDSNVEKNVLIIPIVGMGGLGKTTLAHLVYNDDKVEKNFDLKLLVVVSDDFDVKVIVEKIIESATKKRPDQNLDIYTLKDLLKEKINEKKYLLVLDDVWNEDHEKWLGLEYLLMDGAKGSRIIVTTRSQKVAKITSTVEPYVLQGLSENESWSLFTQLAFEEGQELKNQNLVEIGREIVRKCCGVPLAIRTVGSLLYSENSKDEWESVKNREFSKIIQQETSILPVLKFSYDNLPSHLKHCFAYCRLFPKDHIINVEMLIYLWMGQGFVKPLDPSKCLKEIGLGYFKDLLWRSFFQEPEEDEFGNVTSCKMHDLMHDLAVLVAGMESTTLSSNVEIVPEKTRHILIDNKFNLSERKSLKKNKIRTLFIISKLRGINEERWSGSNFDAIVSNFKRLRVLGVGVLGIKSVPQSIEKLKHLRYLNLSWNEIEVLPSSITRLQNLVILNLSWCKRLKELPEDIGKLISLVHLDIEGCDSLTHMPHGLGQLTSLETLPRFIVSNRGGLNELKGLNSLRGELSIENLNLVKNADSEYNAANLKEKEHLQSLILTWGSEDIGVDAMSMSMEGLQPHRNLKKLVVLNYQGVMSPTWLSFLTNIVNLELDDCERVKHLPPLDGLTSLCNLNLQNCKRLKHLPPLEGLTSLCRLTIQKLTHLEYIHCHGSNCSSPTFFLSLKKLKITECRNLKGWKIVSMETTTELPPFPCLSELVIKNCPRLTSMPLFPSIEGELWLLDSSGKPLEETMMMKTKAASSSSSSSSPPLPLSKLKFLQIRSCDGLLRLEREGFRGLISLRFLEIDQCQNLKSISGVFQHLTALEKLRIRNCIQLDLSDVSIHFPDSWSLQHFTTLQELHILFCFNIKSLPEWMRRLTSLKTLVIVGCPQLLKRCGNKMGVDWPNIAHIPNIQFDLQQIQLGGCYQLG